MVLLSRPGYFTPSGIIEPIVDIVDDTPFEDEDTQEVATRIWLRLEVLSLHVGFSVTDALSSLYQKIMAAPISSDIPTSPPA